jgi:hypothetical protein
MHVLRYRKVWGSALAGPACTCCARYSVALPRDGAAQSTFPIAGDCRCPPAWRFSRKPAFGQTCYRNWYWQA